MLYQLSYFRIQDFGAEALTASRLKRKILWARMDSNHRRHSQQIYSLPHLATLEHAL